jgi:hypothetical protein
VRGAAPLIRRTRCWGIDTRFADFSRSVSPGKHFLAGLLPGLHHIVERSHRNSTSRRGFYFSCRIHSCRFCRSASCWVSARALSKEARLSCRACGTYPHGLSTPGNNLLIRPVPTPHRYASFRPNAMLDSRASFIPRFSYPAHDDSERLSGATKHTTLITEYSLEQRQTPASTHFDHEPES